MIVDEDRKVIVGFTLVGPDVAEMLHATTIVVAGEIPLDRLWHAVPAFPTVSEVWLRLLGSLRPMTHKQLRPDLGIFVAIPVTASLEDRSR